MGLSQVSSFLFIFLEPLYIELYIAEVDISPQNNISAPCTLIVALHKNPDMLYTHISNNKTALWRRAHSVQRPLVVTLDREAHKVRRSHQDPINSFFEF